MRLSRRSVLLGGAGVVTVATTGTLVEYDVLPGRSRAHALLGLTGEAGVVPDVEPGPRVEGVLRSDLVEQDPAYWISYPPGSRPGDPLPLVVALHGAGQTAETWCDQLSLDVFLAASGRRMAVAAVDGGTSSFWHERADGQDAGRMVLEEFLPLLRDQGFDLGQLGLLGWSMGGLGVMMLGARLFPASSVPVLAVSPALWPDFEQAMPGAFDTREQYDGCLALVRREPRTLTRVECGTADPFYRDVREVIADLDIERHYERGAHDPAYWTRELPGQLDWLADLLSAG